MPRYFLAVVLAAVATLAVLALSRLTAEEPSTPPDPAKALEQYIAKPDASYGWTTRREGRLGAGSYVELTLTSQTWRGITWRHQLFIYKPAVVSDGSQALLLVEGGLWNDRLAKAPHAGEEKLPAEANLVAALAESMQAPVAVLLQVPQQPIFGGMVEDQIISHTFAKFLETNDAEWPLLLPMVKSAVRGMDAVQEFAKQEWQLDIDEFLVTGASKRGWTTWLTAAMDSRVSGLAPMVIDMLNMAPHMELQQLSFGGFSEQIRDYTEKGLQDHLDSERGLVLQSIVDPYSYREQLRQPKLIILATNDPYWPVDALNLYWDDLEGEKYVLYVPNNGHGIRDYPRVIGTVAAFHHSLNGGQPLPKLEWAFDDSGESLQLDVASDTTPAAVTVWTASSETRDFRKAQWESRTVRPHGDDGRGFAIDVARPESGFSAVFAEAKFNGQTMPFYLSTNLRVLQPEEESAAAAVETASVSH